MSVNVLEVIGLGFLVLVGIMAILWAAGLADMKLTWHNDDDKDPPQ